MTDRSALNQVRSLQILTGADALLADHTSFDSLGASLTDSQLDPFPDELAEASAASPLSAVGIDHAVAEALLTTVNFEVLTAQQDTVALAQGDAAPIVGDIVHTLSVTPSPTSPIEALVEAALAGTAAGPVDQALAVPSALLGGHTDAIEAIAQTATSGANFELGRAQLGLTSLAHGDAGTLLADVTDGLVTPPSNGTSPVQAIVDAALPSALSTPVDAVLSIPSTLLGPAGGFDGALQTIATNLNFELGRAQLGLTSLAHGDAGTLLADVTDGLVTPPSNGTSPVQAIVDAALPSALSTPVDAVLSIPSTLLGPAGGFDGALQTIATNLNFELGRAQLGLTSLAHGDAGTLLADVTDGLVTPPSNGTSPVQAIVDAALPSALSTPVDAVLSIPSTLLGPAGGFDGALQTIATNLNFELGRAQLGLTSLAHGDAGTLLADVTDGLVTPPSNGTSPVQAIVDAALPSALSAPVDAVLSIPSTLLGPAGGFDGALQTIATNLNFELGRAQLGLTSLAHGDAGTLLADVTDGLVTPPSNGTSPVQAIVDAALPSALSTPVDAVLSIPSTLLGPAGGFDGALQTIATNLNFELGRAQLGLTSLAHGDAGTLLADVTDGLVTPPSNGTSPVQAIVDAALPSALSTPVDAVLSIPSTLLGPAGGFDGALQTIATNLNFELGRAQLGLTSLAHGDAGTLLADVTDGLVTPPSNGTSPVQAIVDAALPSALSAPVDAILAAPSALVGGDIAAIANPQADLAPVAAIVDAAALGALSSGAAGNVGALGGNVATAVDTLTGSGAAAGNVLAPAVHDAASTVVADVTSAGNAVAGAVTGAANALGSVAQGEVGGAVTQVTGAVASLGGAVTAGTNDLVATAHADLGGVVGDVGSTVASLVGTVTGGLAETGSLVQSEVGGTVAAAATAVGSLDSTVTGTLNGAGASIQGDVAALATSATGAVNAVGGTVSGAVNDTVATLHADVTPVVADLTATAGTLATSATAAVGAAVATVQADLGTIAADVVTAGASLSGSVTGVVNVAQTEIGHVAADVTNAATLAAATVSGDTSAALTGATQLVGTTLTETASTVHTGLDTVATGAAGAVTTAVASVGTGVETATSTLHAALDATTTGATTALTTAGTIVGATVAEAASTAHTDVASLVDYTGSTLTSVTGAVGANLGNVASALHADGDIITGDVGSVVGTATGAIGTGLVAATSTVHADLTGLATGIETTAAHETGALETGLATAPADLSAAVGSATGEVGTASAMLTHAAGTGIAEVASTVTAGLAAVTGGSGGAASTVTGAIGAGLAETATVAHDAAVTTTAALTAVTSAAPTVTSLVTIASGDAFHFPTSSGAGIDALHGIVSSAAAPVTSAVDGVSHAVVAAVVDHVDVPHLDPLAALSHAVHHA